MGEQKLYKMLLRLWAHRTTGTNQRFSFVYLRLKHRNDQIYCLRGNGTRVFTSWLSGEVFSLQEEWRREHSRMESEYFDVKSTHHLDHPNAYSGW